MSDQKRAVELAVDKLLREAAKKLGITEQCFYNVFHHAEDVIKVDDSYMYAMELHYNVYVPTGASEKFKKLINPILLTGGMEVVEMEPGEAYDEKNGTGKTILGFFLHWHHPDGPDTEYAMEDASHEKAFCDRVGVKYDDAVEKRLMDFESGIYPDTNSSTYLSNIKF